MLESVWCDCPYCGEPIELLIDSSVPHQDYIEDCSVCCSPINVSVVIDDDGLPDVVVRTDQE
ncbi:MAG: CPXCG motif-containing cysteine-rich protein [Gammaproteobacteria bacterium HGW-Gammaproteobacteria-14]|nr:MAG: CPXCG motif-containing cysteine-rich protein [Gammaproteobacteria bacterium HGW-Gammaproteobacteria-14]